MKEFLETKISAFNGDILDTRPIGRFSINRLISHIKNPPDKYKWIYKELGENPDSDRKSELKLQLPSVTPSATVKKVRTYDEIEDYTGVLVVDIDKMKAEDVDKVKNILFYDLYGSFMAFKSASGKGVRAFVRTFESSSKLEYHSRFEALLVHLKRLLEGIECEIDEQMKNAVQPMFLSWDEEIMVREPDEIFAETKVIERVNLEPAKVGHTRKGEKFVKRQLDKVLDEIKISKHTYPSLNRAALVIGRKIRDGEVKHFWVKDYYEKWLSTNFKNKNTRDENRETIENGINDGISKPKIKKI